MLSAAVACYSPAERADRPTLARSVWHHISWKDAGAFLFASYGCCCCCCWRGQIDLRRLDMLHFHLWLAESEEPLRSQDLRVRIRVREEPASEVPVRRFRKDVHRIRRTSLGWKARKTHFQSCSIFHFFVNFCVSTFIESGIRGFKITFAIKKCLKC